MGIAVYNIFHQVCTRFAVMVLWIIADLWDLFTVHYQFTGTEDMVLLPQRQWSTLGAPFTITNIV